MRAATPAEPPRLPLGTAGPVTSPTTRRPWKAARSPWCSSRSRRRLTSNGRSAHLRRGKHVIVEKPPFLHAADFDEVAAAASPAGRQVLVAENYFYKPLAGLLRTIVQDAGHSDSQVHSSERVEGARLTGELARRSGAGRRRRAVRRRHPLGQPAREHRPDAGADPCRVPGAGAPADRNAAVTLEYEEGAVATLHYSWDLRGAINGVRFSQMYGTSGSVFFETNGVLAVVDRPAPAVLRCAD